MYDLGNLLKQLREEKHVSMDKMIEDLKALYSISIAKSTISKWENNKADPSIENAKVLCKYFDVSLDYLLGLSNYKNNQEELSTYKDTITKSSSRDNKNFYARELLDNFYKLNTLGKSEATKRVEELTHIRNYVDDNNNDELCATLNSSQNTIVEMPRESKKERLQDYFTTIAAHNDDLTEEEKIIAEQKVLEALKRSNLI